jgi:AraC-like DNA-binding protein
MKSVLTLELALHRAVGTDYRYPEHSHAMHQWYCLIKGDVELTLDGQPFRLSSGESMLIEPGVARMTRCCGRAPTYLFAIFQNHDLTLDGLTQRVVETPPELRPDLATLATEVRSPAGADSRALVEALLVRLLIGLRRAVQGQRIRGDTDAGLVNRVEAFMQSNMRKRLTRQQLAKAVHLSPPHVARVFRAVTGKTLGQRLTEIRLELAKSLLIYSTLPISQIAGDVGFDSISHFTQVFKRHVSMLPSQFRKEYGVTTS